MTEFRGNLGNYKIVKTDDQTETVWSEFFDEACHNLSGAYQETIHNYILGCEIPDLINLKPEVFVLDVGFGVGIGLKAIKDQLLTAKNPNLKLYYYSIELDEVLLLWALKTTHPDLKLIRKEINFENEKLLFYQGIFQNNNQTIDIQIYVGDGRLTLPLANKLKLVKSLDAIFQDAFSPKKNPTLWSVEWFEFLKLISKESVILSTYSSSVSIRKSLIAAHWKVFHALGFASKKAMTRAKLTGQISEALLDQMNRSPSLEIRDK